MAKLNKLSQSPAAQLFSQIGTNLLETTRTEVADKKAVGSVVGLEGYTDMAAHGTRVQTEEKLVGKIKSAIAQQGAAFGIAAEEFTGSQLEAGAMILMAAGSPKAYAHAAMSENYPALESGDVEGPAISTGEIGRAHV